MESTSNFNSRHLICLLFLLAGFGLFAENPVPITPGTQGTPINDNACNAIALSVNTLTTFENYTASKQSGEASTSQRNYLHRSGRMVYI